MSEPIKAASEMLSRAVEEYLVARYPDSDLKHLAKRAIQFQDSALARSLYHWRESAAWKSPHLIGVRRCVVCTVPMDDEEPSACEDETVCRSCVVPHV